MSDVLNRMAVALLVAAALTGCEKPAPTDRVQGYVEGEFLYVAAPFPGRLKQLAVQRGQQVRAGTPLFALEAEEETAARDEAEARLAQAKATLADLRTGRRPSEVESLEAQLTQARAALELSSSELRRQEQLVQSGAISANDLDRSRSMRNQNAGHVAQIEADLKTARLGSREDQIEAAEAEVRAREAALASARWALSQKVQASGQDAQVQDTLYREGEWVPAGRPVVVLLPPAQVKVRAFVPQARISAIHAGDAVRVFVDGVDQPFSGRVSFLSPQAEYTPPVIYSRESRAKLVFMIEAAVDEAAAKQLHPGQPVEVALAQ